MKAIKVRIPHPLCGFTGLLKTRSHIEANSHLFPLRRMDIRLSSIDYIQMMVNEEDDEESLNEKAEQPKK